MRIVGVAKFWAVCGALLAASMPALGQQLQVDPALPAYERASGISGSLTSVGSDTMNNLVTYWAEGFARLYPNVKVQVEGKGSSTAPPALIAGTAQLGPMSREMKPSEVDGFERRFGYRPTELRVAIDALAVYVHKDNPLETVTLAQLDAVFSKDRRRGYPEAVHTWGQLGLAESWASRRISLYGRNSASGTYGFFKEHVLLNGDFKDEVKEQPGSASVVQSVAADLGGIGYSGIGYRTSGVKTLALAEKEGQPAAAPTPENVYEGTYPLARFLLLYINRTPGKPLDPLVREFVRFALSRVGQELVIKSGYLPLTAAMVAEEKKG